MNPENQPQPETPNTPTTEPATGQSAVTPPTPLEAPAAPSVTPTAENPGQTLSIIGLVLAFLFPLVGIVLSIIGHSKSKKANASTTVGTVGIVLNIISLIISLIYTILVSMTAYSGIQEKAQQSLQEACMREPTAAECVDK